MAAARVPPSSITELKQQLQSGQFGLSLYHALRYTLAHPADDQVSCVGVQWISETEFACSPAAFSCLLQIRPNSLHYNFRTHGIACVGTRKEGSKTKWTIHRHREMQLTQHTTEAEAVRILKFEGDRRGEQSQEAASAGARESATADGFAGYESEIDAIQIDED